MDSKLKSLNSKSPKLINKSALSFRAVLGRDSKDIRDPEL